MMEYCAGMVDRKYYLATEGLSAEEERLPLSWEWSAPFGKTAVFWENLLKKIATL